ncbi:MAG: glycosyltransferase family 2 protein [Nitrospirae bacterium]|nr:glycosyltransferase family 2 protein [Nitrospirota bacterium]
MKSASFPHISIIIPIYNVETYLRDCLDSVVNQTLREIEIICVNDCSTDGSLSIVREYEAKDNRIKVIDKQVNEGLATTRNVGMAEATGKYMLFMDSDDFADTDLCRKAAECAEAANADLVIYDYAAFYRQEDLKENSKQSSRLTAIAPTDRVALLKCHAFAWTKLIRSDLVRSLHILFPAGLIYEDLPVHWQIITQASKIAILPEPLYYYRQRKTSITYRRNWSITDRILIFDRVREFLISRKLYEDYCDLFLQSQLEMFCWLYDTIASDHKERALVLIQDHLAKEHLDYIDSGNPLSWKTRAFFKALQGSRVAKIRHGLWLFARAGYRRLKRKAEEYT